MARLPHPTPPPRSLGCWEGVPASHNSPHCPVHRSLLSFAVPFGGDASPNLRKPPPLPPSCPTAPSPWGERSLEKTAPPRRLLAGTSAHPADYVNSVPKGLSHSVKETGHS